MQLPPYLLIPRDVIVDKNLTPTDEKIYAAVWLLAGQGQEECTASNQTIAEIAGVGQEVRNSITRLVENGYIEANYGDEKKRTRKSLNPLVVIGRVSVSAEMGVSGNTETGVSGNTEQKKTSNKKDNNTFHNETLQAIYDHYKKKICSSSRLTEKAKSKIATRLKTFSSDELYKAINNFSDSQWWMDKNSHRGVAWFFHSDDRIDQFLNLKPDFIEGVHYEVINGKRYYYGNPR